MISNELRIGNWVKSLHQKDDKPVLLDEWEFGYLLSNELKPEPIPLTAEWMLKFGFGQDGLAPARLKLDTEYGINTIYIKGMFVHQLQNLYFALTNEELTIKGHDSTNLETIQEQTN